LFQLTRPAVGQGDNLAARGDDHAGAVLCDGGNRAAEEQKQGEKREKFVSRFHVCRNPFYC